MLSQRHPGLKSWLRAMSINVHDARLSRVDLPAGGVEALGRASVHY